MNFFYFLPIILIAEIVIILSLFFLLIIKRISLYFEAKFNEEEKKQITQFFLRRLKNQKDNSINLSKVSKESLISVIETFDDKFKGGSWEDLKLNVTNNFLLPSARKWSTSFFWTKRNLAARIFILMPLKQDEESILQLIDDKEFLVRSFASIAAVKLKSEKGIKKIIDHMSHNFGYSHYFYRDILLKGDKEIFSWIEEIALSSKKTKVLLTCLEILAEKSMFIKPTLLDKSLHSKNREVVLAASKLFAHNPQKQSAAILYELSQSDDERIREQAAIGLGYFLNKKNIDKLEILLDDPSSSVRLQAAKTLKRAGKIGIDILKNQSAEKHKKAYDTAQMVLEFE